MKIKLHNAPFTRLLAALFLSVGLIGVSGCAQGAATPSPSNTQSAAPATVSSSIPPSPSQSPVLTPPTSAAPSQSSAAAGLNKSGIQKALDAAGTDVYDVAWSPDGSMVLFIRNEKQESNMYIWKTGQNSPVFITKDTGTTEGFKWSPDSRYFTINVGHMGPGTVTTTVIDASSVKQVGEEITSSKSSSPIWSPDSKYLALSLQSQDDSGLIRIALYSISDKTTVVLLKSKNTYGPYVLLGWENGFIRFTETASTGEQMESEIKAP